MAKFKYIPNRVIDTNGISDGATIAVYQAGTTTPVPIYSDEELTVPLTNPLPVVAGAPVPAFYFDGPPTGVRVKVVDGGGATVDDDDPYNPPASSSDLASTDTGKGAALVAFQQVGAHAKARQVRDEMLERVSVTQFTGATDSAMFANAFLDHPGRVIHIPYRDTPYSLTETLTPPADTTLVFERGATLSLDFDGDAIELLDSVYIYNMTLNGNGATQTNGRGVVVGGSNGKNGLVDCKIFDTAGPCIEFLNVDAGSYFYSINSDLARYGSPTLDDTRAVIVIADGETAILARPRVFSNTRTNGWVAVSFGGSNDTFFTGGGYHGGFIFSEYCRGVKITGLRWGNQTAVNVKGANISIVGCGIAPALTIPVSTVSGSQQSITIVGNDMNNPRIIDNSGRPGTNVLQHRPVSDQTLGLRADTTPVTITAGNARTRIYRNGGDYVMDVALIGSWQGGVATPGGFGSASSINLDVPTDYLPIYETFVGPLQMVYNGSQKLIYGRLFGTTTGAGAYIRLGYLGTDGAFTPLTAAMLNAGPVTYIIGTLRWNRSGATV